MKVDNEVKCPHCGHKFDFSVGFIQEYFENNRLEAICEKCRQPLVFMASILSNVMDSAMNVAKSIMIDVQPVNAVAQPPPRQKVRNKLGEAILLGASVGKTRGDEEQLDKISESTKKDLDELFGSE